MANKKDKRHTGTKDPIWFRKNNAIMEPKYKQILKNNENQRNTAYLNVSGEILTESL